MSIALSRIGQFLLFLLAGGLISLWKRKDLNWDLQNYHFYNPWAWVNGRLAFDLAPAQSQTYLSPFLDMPFFLMVQADLHPMVIGFLMGLPFGAAVAFFYWIVRFASKDLPHRERLFVTILSLLVGLTGAAGLPLVGSTMNEWHTTALVMAGVFIAMRLCVAPVSLRPGWSWIAVGLLLGAATGLKLTAATYCLAIAIAAASMHAFWAPAQRLALFGLALGGLLGFGLTYGYWAVVLANNFANPFFPYFNNLFESPLVLQASGRDDRFVPKTVLDAILFPVRLAQRGMTASDTSQRDPRLLMLMVSLLGIVATLYIRKTSLRQLAFPGADGEACAFARSFRFLVIFTASAYVIWLVQFSIYRYFIPAELAASLLLVLCLWLLARPARTRGFLVAAICLFVVSFTDRPQWGRAKFGEKYFDVAVPPIPAGSLVLLYGGAPLGYLLPFLGASHRYVRPSSNLTHPSYAHGLQRAIADAINEHSGSLYALRKLDEDPVHEKAVLTAYRLRIVEEGCMPVRSSVHRYLVLCPLTRVG